MHILFLNPGLERLDCQLLDFRDGACAAVRKCRLAGLRGRSNAGAAALAVRRWLRRRPLETGGDAAGNLPIVCRVPMGGTLFREPAFFTTETRRKLETLVPLSPLHLPRLLLFLDRLAAALPECPLALVFETAFFVRLPRREALYAVDQELLPAGLLRRSGYHGLFHAAACRLAAADRRRDHHATAAATAITPALPPPAAAKILSLGLNPQPEVAAVIGSRPVLVTSGVTPLEGLPGETTCGDLDPSLILLFLEKEGWGPEQINQVLTRESGMLGLTGTPVKLGALFRKKLPAALAPARDLLLHRLLLAAGSAAAAMGGIDDVVVSGRYARAGMPGLKHLLRTLFHRAPRQPAWHLATTSLAAAAIPAALPLFRP